MAERQFEINRRIFAKKCSIAILLGSIITTWWFILENYLVTINLDGYYSSPFSILEMHFLCMPYFAYQFPAYLTSGMIGISVVKREWIKSAIGVFVGVGILGWLISTIPLFLFFTLPGDDVFESILFSILTGLPSLSLYLVFLFPKRTENI